MRSGAGMSSEVTAVRPRSDSCSGSSQICCPVKAPETSPLMFLFALLLRLELDGLEALVILPYDLRLARGGLLWSGTSNSDGRGSNESIDILPAMSALVFDPPDIDRMLISRASPVGLDRSPFLPTLADLACW